MPPSDFVMPARFSLDVPNFGDYFGIWLIEPNSFGNLVNRYQGINLHAHIGSARASEEVARQSQREYQVTPDGIAMFSIAGPMMKSVSSMSGGTSTIAMRSQLRNARNDAEVKGGFLKMDTPGGTVSGNSDLAEEVAKFAAVKPIYAFVEDMTASGGVSVASQANKRYANNPAALYGAMGVFSVLEDSSGQAEMLGIKVHVIKAGEFKGMAQPGTEITDAHLAHAQQLVNAMYESYTALIAKGLGQDAQYIRTLADGRLHPASEAVKMQLIDGIQSFDETYSQLVAATKQQRPTPMPPMRRMKMETQAATLAELKATFPKSDANWREQQLEAGATLEKASIAYAQHVEAKAEAAAKATAEAHAKELEDAKADAKGKQNAHTIGHAPVVSRGRAAAGLSDDEYVESGEPIADFNALVASLSGPRPDLGRRQRAIRTAANRNPALYEQYMLATNSGSRNTRLIKEKLEASLSK